MMPHCTRPKDYGPRLQMGQKSRCLLFTVKTNTKRMANYQEWGDPNDKTYYDYTLSWSPYGNVRAADYPAILATGGLNDTQVPYFSPAKWVQKVREANTGREPVYLKINMGAGHAGESGRFQSQKETAMVYAFMIDQVEMELVD